MESLTTLLNKNLDVTDLTSVQNTITTIEKYMTNISTQVGESVSEQYGEVTQIMSQTDDTYRRARQYVGQFRSLNEQIDKHLSVELVSTEVTQKALMNGMLKSEFMISILHQVCQVHETLEEVSECSDVLEEAQRLKVAELKLQELRHRKLTPAIVAQMMDKVSDRLLVIFKEAADWSSEITIEGGCIRYSESVTEVLDDKIAILDIIASTEITTLAEVMAASIHRELVMRIIGQGDGLVVEKNSCVRTVSSDRAGIKRVSDLSALFHAINTQILPSNQTFRQSFWGVLLEDFLPEMKSLIKDSVPKSLSELSEFAEQYIPAVGRLEECIMEFAGSQLGKALSSYVSDYQLLFSHKFRERSYDEARRILLSTNDESTTTVHSLLSTVPQLSSPETRPPPRDPCSPLTLSYPGSEAALRLPDFRVSQRVVELAALVTSILQQATSDVLSTDAALCLCATSKNVAELFIIPAFSPYIENLDNPRESAQFYCDCWYLSHVLFWSSNELSGKLPNEMYFDVVSLIRNKGCHVLECNERSLHDRVGTLLKQVGGLDGQNKENHGMVIEMAFVQISAVIIQYTSEWRKVLPSVKSVTMTTHVIDTTLDLILTDTLTIPDISAKHSTCLSNNFNLLLDQLSKVYSDNDTVKHSVSWHRFKWIISILDVSLVTIVENWENGPLSEYFTSSEVQHLTRALFQNSEKNAALRRRIKDPV